MFKSSKRLSASRPVKDNKENIATFDLPSVPDANGISSTGDDTPVKRGTMARIKDTFFSPFRGNSPTNSPKGKSLTGNFVEADGSISGRVLFAPGIAPELETKKGAIPMKRGSSKRTPSRKSTNGTTFLFRRTNQMK